MEEAVVTFNIYFCNPFAADLRSSIFLNPFAFLAFSHNSGFVRIQDVVCFDPEAFCFWGWPRFFYIKSMSMPLTLSNLLVEDGKVLFEAFELVLFDNDEVLSEWLF